VIDLLQAAQDAVFAVLKPIEGSAGVAGLAVYQHVPENAQPPMAVIGAIASANAEEHADQVETISIEIHAVFRGPGRAPLLAILHAVRTALDGQQLPSEVVSFERPRFQKAEAGDALADGMTYVGMSTFEFLAEPA
jgi:hypothetical protein